MSQEDCAFVFIVEGDTDEYFYNRFLDVFNYRKGFNNVDFKIINAKGIGKFKGKAIRKCDDYLLNKKKPGVPTNVFLCYDYDIFNRRFAQKPPFVYEELRKEFLKRPDIKSVSRVIANESIEDWFLCDLENICEYLNIKYSKNSALSGTSGEDKLKHLFKKANKVYVKGSNPDAGKFIDNLNLELIIRQNKDALKEFNEILSTYR